MDSVAVEQKLSSYQTMVVTLVLVLMSLAVAVLIAAVVFFVRADNAAHAERHRSDQALSCFIHPQLDRAEDTLPTLAYYKAHPKELDEQLGYLKQQRRLALDAWGACDQPPPE